MTKAPVLRAIGVLRTPWATLSACPRNGRQPDPAPRCQAVVAADFAPAVSGIDGFSHLILLYWLGPAPDDAPLVIRPRFDNQPRGVFATRAPVRPNPIGLSVVLFDGVSAPGVLDVRYLDCVDGTPLLDIKPYLPTTDAEPNATMGWLSPAPLGTTAGLG